MQKPVSSCETGFISFSLQTKAIQNKKAAQWAAISIKLLGFLSLTGFEARLCLVDHVDTAFTAYYAAITMPVLQRAK